MTVKMAEPSKRLFVGNLFPEVSQQDLQKRFEKYGNIDSIEIKTKKDIDGKVVSTFAFVDLNVSDKGLVDCISMFSNTKWKGHVLRLQQAKESFMDRLAKERKEKEDRFKATSQEDMKYNPLQMLKNKNEVDVNSSNLEIIPEKKKKRKSLGTDVPEVTIESKYSYTPFNMLKNRNGNEGGSEMDGENQNVDEGTVGNGLVSFENEAEVVLAKVIKQTSYNSDSEEEGNKDESVIKEPEIKKILTKEEKAERKIANKEKKKKAMERVDKRELRLTESVKPIQGVKPGSVPRKRYYSSSSEEETEEKERKTGDDVMKTLGSFSNFWNDEEEEKGEGNHTNNAKENIGVLNSFKQKSEDVKKEKFEKKNEDEKRRRLEKNEGKENKRKDKSNDQGTAIKEQQKTTSKSKESTLQSKAISDDRFKMDSKAFEDDIFKTDSRFCDKSDDDDYEEDYELENQVDLPNDNVNDRSRNLDILSSLLGKDVAKDEKVKRKGALFKDSSRLRFDPDQEDHHVKFLRKEATEATDKDDGAVGEDDDKADTDIGTDESKKRYFEVSKSLKEGFSNKNTSNSGGFSFGFGQSEKKDEKAGSFRLLPDQREDGNRGSKSAEESSNPFKCDSDEEDGLEELVADSKQLEASKFGLQLKGKGSTGLKESFFFQEGDERLEEGLNFFFKQDVDFDALRVAFNAQRPQLSAILKKKMRQKAKRNEKMKFGGVKKKENGFKGRRKYKNKK